MSALLQAREKLGTGAAGLWALTRAVCYTAPYFASIAPRITRFDPGHVEVLLKKRRRVTNHLGTVHAIAMCNLAELAGGTCIEITRDQSLRWIPVGMEVKYLKLAKTDLRGVCELDPATLTEPGDAVAPVDVFDTGGQKVFEARITMRLSHDPKKRGST